MSIEKHLIEHCSETLASLKTANLFGFEYDCESELLAHINDWNKRLNHKGVYVKILKKENGRALIYVYRKDKLTDELNESCIVSFLKQYGYNDFNIESVMETLQQHLSTKKEFPHEIGIFLGYPLNDVIGFIENQGKNSKCCGYWKVYGDESEAQKLFCRFKKCRDVYMRHWNKGKSVWQLTVAA